MSRFEQRTIDDMRVLLRGQEDIPVIVFHRGPGFGLNPRYAAYFDETRHPVVLFDQKGTGRSGTAGSIARNSDPK